MIYHKKGFTRASTITLERRAFGLRQGVGRYLVYAKSTRDTLREASGGPPPGGQPRGSAADALGVLLGKANCRGRVALAAPARGGLALGLALPGAGRILNDADDGRPSEEDLLVRSKTRGRATLRRPWTRCWRLTSES